MGACKGPICKRQTSNPEKDLGQARNFQSAFAKAIRLRETATARQAGATRCCAQFGGQEGQKSTIEAAVTAGYLYDRHPALQFGGSPEMADAPRDLRARPFDAALNFQGAGGRQSCDESQHCKGGRRSRMARATGGTPVQLEDGRTRAGRPRHYRREGRHAARWATAPYQNLQRGRGRKKCAILPNEPTGRVF